MIMGKFTFISSLAYVVLLIFYMTFSNSSAAFHKLYFMATNYIIGTLFLFISGLKINRFKLYFNSPFTLKKGRLTFFLSVAALNYSIIIYNIIDWQSRFRMDYWLVMCFCLFAVLTFVIGWYYDRKDKR